MVKDKLTIDDLRDRFGVTGRHYYVYRTLTNKIIVLEKPQKGKDVNGESHLTYLETVYGHCRDEILRKMKARYGKKTK